jgi:ribosome-binding protein aMBF1 (putative translation factor)
MRKLTDDATKQLQNQIRLEVGQYIERKRIEQESVLKREGTLDRNKKLSQSQLARMVGISSVWMNSICRGEKIPNDEILLKIANTLMIDENELFKIARRLPPQLLEQMKKEFLEDYYIPNLEM